MITDANGTIIDVNGTFSQITGYSYEEAIGRNPRMLKSGRQPTEYYQTLWHSLLDSGHWYGEVWNRRKSGEVFAEMQTISAVRDADGKTLHYVSLFSDITPLKQHQQELERIAHYDALTQLPNRVLLADRLRQGLIQSQRHKHSLAVVFLDLDGFKAINDAHGHAAGDKLLIEVAQRIKGALREGDTLSRIGGDEFVAILADLEKVQSCEPVLARMLQAASSPVMHGQHALQVTASMGVTLYPQDGSDADLLMRHADQAMYAAKQAGKNRYHLFDVVQDVATRSRRESVERILRALALGEFVLHYQPKVNLRSGAVVGVEALIRWQHPQRGLLLPHEFLPEIEEHPGSIQIGEWVLETALQQIEVWKQRGKTIPVSVNIGAHQLQSGNFAERLQQLLRNHPEVSASNLQIEVLETSALQDLAKVGVAMNACHAVGVSFALDDFGTGYSSLTYLKHLPAKTLKIDQSFVRDMLTDESDLAIVNGVIGLASAFGREVIAEGVETRAHGDLLLSLGCELAQGFGIARPMPVQALGPWLDAWSRSAEWAA
jgi:diguanylate cyclase (GGDEF)-like protein/PAS domain S-box-containing protein